MEMMGWKYNMDDIQAALLINQIDRIDEYRHRREVIETSYRTQLSGVRGLGFIQPPAENESSAHHLFTILLPADIDRDAFLIAMQEKKVGCAVNYRAVHVLSYFRNNYGYLPMDFPSAFDIGCKTVTLPMYPKLTDEEVITVCYTVQSTIEELRRG
jgi:dTDP-4-amino-4,6-dideoxygalactose transaminase